ncbi:MAG: glycosyl transferase [Bacteroidetes bacterium]|nr:MAG: glycosyl transferase [Bacteroidota bacterium]
MNNEVSIIMPVYNAEEYVSFAIESVLSQTYGLFEFIIIDDCSTDKTSKIIGNYAKNDNRIKVIKNSKNLKIVKSLNIGLRAAKYKFIARIDADDIWVNNKLEIQLKEFELNNNLYLLGTAKTLIDSSGQKIASVEKPIFKYSEIKSNILKYNLFCHSSVMYRKEIIDIVGYYNEKYKNSEDYEYWIRIIKDLHTEILPQKLVFYRITDNMVSLTKRKQQYYYVIKAKLLGFKLYGFKFSYLKYILNDLYIISVPKFMITFKRFLFGKKH